MTEKLIKSRQRVKEHAEVYTPKFVVDGMLDLMEGKPLPSQDNPHSVTERFLEPACGNGNFLVEILRRKLAFLTSESLSGIQDLSLRRIAWETLTIAALASICGVDIQEDNVLEARNRMGEVLLEHVRTHAPMEKVTNGFAPAVLHILSTNIVAGDWLHDRIDWTFYSVASDEFCFGEWGYFYRLVLRQEPVRTDGKPFTEADRNGKHLATSTSVIARDELPVHYIGFDLPIGDAE